MANKGFKIRVNRLSLVKWRSGHRMVAKWRESILHLHHFLIRHRTTLSDQAGYHAFGPIIFHFDIFDKSYFFCLAFHVFVADQIPVLTGLLHWAYQTVFYFNPVFDFNLVDSGQVDCSRILFKRIIRFKFCLNRTCKTRTCITRNLIHLLA